MNAPERRDADRATSPDRSASPDGGVSTDAAARALFGVAARSADDALVLELADDAGNVELVFGAARVPGVLRAPPAWLVEGATHEIMVLVGEEPIGVDVRVVAGAAVQAGQVARVAFLGLEIAGRPLRVASSSAPGLAGKLEDVPLVDLVQLVCGARRSAVIELGNDTVQGFVACRDGRAVAARCDNGPGGDEAFFALAAAHAGWFAVHYDRAVADENLHGDPTWLALEAMRRQDEAAGRSSSLSSSSLPPREATGAGWDPFLSQPPTAVVDAPRVDARTVAPGDGGPAAAASRSVPLVPIRAVEPATTTKPAPPLRPSGVPLPRQIQGGRFARFFEELGDALRVDSLGAAPPALAGRTAPPVPADDVIEIDLDRELDDDDTTARLRFRSLQVPVPHGDDEAPTDIVRRLGSLST